MNQERNNYRFYNDNTMRCNVCYKFFKNSSLRNHKKSKGHKHIFLIKNASINHWDSVCRGETTIDIIYELYKHLDV